MYRDRPLAATRGARTDLETDRVNPGPPAGGRVRVLAGFAALGVFWGSWGALVPAVQARARADDGELGIALLMVGLGALFSMRVTGAFIDRHGGRVLPIVAGLFAAAGLLPGLAGSPVSLAGALLVVGITSGALDVASPPRDYSERRWRLMGELHAQCNGL